ncbi:hydrolase [Planctomycetota bacterium]|nr:hydrolase [Planctomycetota bacterium]
MTTIRLKQQLNFINELEKLKTVYRRNRTADRTRFENSAEHSWHVALIAMVFSEYSDNKTIDMFKVIKLILVHDLIEIYAGDTWLYDDKSSESQHSRENQAANKLFNLLPKDQSKIFKDLWHEFEDEKSPESKFAQSIDLLQPLLNHLLSGSSTDDVERPTTKNVINKKCKISDSSNVLWELAVKIIEDSTKMGLYLADETVKKHDNAQQGDAAEPVSE